MSEPKSQQADTSASTTSSPWTTAPERGSKFLMQVMTWLSLHLGRRVSRVVLYPIAAYFTLFSRTARAASRSYLQRALGRPPTWLDLYRHIFAFAATIHDRIYLINDRFELFDIAIHNEHVVLDALREQRGVLLLGAHMGSFEVIRAMGRQHPQLRVSLLMFEENARKINSMFAAINPAWQQDIIALGQVDSMLQVHERLAGGGVIGILADRTLGADACVNVPFFGTSAAFPLGPFRMAALLRCPVVFMAGLYEGNNRYSIHFAQLADFSDDAAGARSAAVQVAVTQYAAVLEDFCRQQPYNWFNFFDFWASKTPQ